MAFPWSVIRAAKPTRGHLVEDRIIGIDLALQGYPPRFCPAVRVVSELPSRDVAAFSQRRRWEHGQLASMLQAGTTLVAAGLRRLNPGLVALGVDLLVPPLALLTLWIMGLLVLSALFAVISGMWLPLAATTAVTAVLAAGVLAGWLRHGRELVPLRYAVAIPFYVLRKIPIYLAFSTGARQQSWERSERTRGRSGANKPEP
jgi:cellulose synthase/poly-beta-1,6-N-acetylglucosamine synthase-like glycosyltransferase